MEFRILGPLEVGTDAGVIALGGPLPRALLAMLLLHANRPVPVERLTTALWGEDAPAAAGRTLQVYVSRLRKALGDRDRLVIAPAGYLLRVLPGELDAEHFERHVTDGLHAAASGELERAASELQAALSLWRGPALAELATVWLAPAELARLEERRLTAVEARIEAELGLGSPSELVAELQWLVAAHPWRERLHAQLMLALYRAGRQADALDAFRSARAVLVEQLGIEPGRELCELQQAILAHAGSLDATRVTADRLPDGRGALPTPATPLFGREADVNRLRDHLSAPSSRLVTLVGPGGVGKTRVAIEAARRLAEVFTDGRLFAALASVSDPRDLVSAITRSLGAPLREDEPPAAALRRFLGDRHVLLVLDNFEQLMPGTPVVADLLSACPRLTVLITSREPTRLSAERLHPLQPLEDPGAVAMFLDRARARDPGLLLDDATAPHVVNICRRLDGLPLALELAAARVGLLAPGELAARLDQSLTVLTSGASDAPERHRTLRATIDWSYRLLTDAERRAFMHFGVFSAGATVTAAERVTAATLDTLDSLVAKQLLVRRGDRLLMLATVREYALEQLAEDPDDSEDLHHRLGTWCRDFAREANPHLVQADRVRWLARLERELPNALAALSWALEQRATELALALVGALGPYWWHTNRWEEGRAWIDAGLERSNGEFPHARANALLYRARLTGVRHTRRYREDLQAGLELFRACEDARGIIFSLGQLAGAEAWIGDHAQARLLLDEATRIALRAQDQDALAFVLTQTAFAATAYEEASPLTRSAVARLRRIGDLSELAHVCNWTGYLALVECRYHEALAWFDEGLDAARRLEAPAFVYLLRSNQGLAWLFLDELVEAARAFSDALAVCDEADAEDLVDQPLLGLAAVAARRGELGRAARLAAAAHAHANASPGREEAAIVSRLNDAILAAGRQGDDRERWDHAARAGGSLTVQDAIDLALASA